MTNLSEKLGGGLIYSPAMMKFDGTTGYYNKGYTRSGNKVTCVVRFSEAAYTGSALKSPMNNSANSCQTPSLIMFSSDDATYPNRRSRLQLQVQNSAATVICRLISNVVVCDGRPHTVFCAFDGDLGTVIFRIDGQNADDTGNADRIAPVTGTLSTTSPTLVVGAFGLTPTYPMSGNIGFFGLRDAYLTNWYDFMDQYGNPKPINETSWTQWGAQPLFWNKHGDMVNNLGSQGAMTKNGTINVGDGGAGPFQMIGLPTTGTAVAADVREGQIAWVGGIQVTGTIASGLLFWHQFDGINGLNINGTKPTFCYDNITTLVTSSAPLLNGSGYIIPAANNTQVIIDPSTRWPSRVGKTRVYEVWGRYTAAPTSSSDYMPQLRLNELDSSNVWQVRLGHTAGAAYAEQYEWIAGALGEILGTSGSPLSIGGAFRWHMKVEDQGNQILLTISVQRESTEASDLTITQIASVQLYKATRPNQTVAKFAFRWESPSNYAKCELRGMMVYDR